MDLFNWFSESLVHAFGWTVLHSLWQGSVLALVLAFFFWLFRDKSASLRYRLGYGFLLLQLAISAFTFGRLYAPIASIEKEPIVIDTSGAAVINAQQILDQIELSYWEIFAGILEDNMDFIVLFWVSGMIFFFFRLFFGFVGLQHLRRSGQQMAQIWEDRLGQIATQMGVKRSIALLTSAKVNSPMLIGQLRPMILLPIGMINQLTPSQVEAVLAHELAHLRRYDYWFNLLQLLIEAVFYYHPAIWWMSYRIREEREHCCDDLAVRVCGDELLYAKTLYTLEAMRRPPTLSGHRLAMNFGGTRKQSLLDRINRIISTNYPQSNSMEKFTITSLLLGAVLLLTVSTAWNNKEVKLQDEQALIEGVLIDSLPMGKTRMSTTYQGQKVETEVIDGKIKRLKIDGKRIAEEDFEQYEDMVSEMMEQIPAPPVPPTPPAPPSGVPAPPSPPTPPSPNSWTWSKDGASNIARIDVRETEDGKQEIIIQEKGGAPQILVVPDDVVLNLGDFDGWEGLKELEKLENLESLEGLESIGNAYWYHDEDGVFHFDADSLSFALQMAEEALENLPEHLENAFEGLEYINDENIVINLSDVNDSLRIVFEDGEWQSNLKEAIEEARRGMDSEEFRQGFDEAMKAVENVLEDLSINIHINDDHFIYNDGDFGDFLYDKLVQEGTIKQGDRMSVKLTAKELRINGKKQDAAMHQKVKSWYREQTGSSLSEKDSVEIKMTKD